MRETGCVPISQLRKKGLGVWGNDEVLAALGLCAKWLMVMPNGVGNALVGDPRGERSLAMGGGERRRCGGRSNNRRGAGDLASCCLGGGDRGVLRCAIAGRPGRGGAIS